MMMMMMKASLTCRILLLCIVSVALQQGSGLPLSEDAVQMSHPSHIRTKRCSCNSWEDKECIYFCHLDIIWVNTASKLLPYGLGSPRRRRSANRCECLQSADRGCRGFCYGSSEDTGGETLKPSVKAASQLLASFRLVIKSNMAASKRLRSKRDPNNKTRR